MNKRLPKILLLSTMLIIFTVMTMTSQPEFEGKIVDQLHKILLEAYDNFENKTPMERLVMRLGKRTYVDSLAIWHQNYDNLDSIPITLHKTLRKMADIAEEHHTKDRAMYFRNLLTDLTRLGFDNLDIYYIATMKYFENRELKPDDYTIDMLDEAMCEPDFYTMRKKMYETEAHLKSEIKLVMQEGKLKYKLALYLFAFNFFDKIRVKIIERDMAQMQQKIEAIQANTTDS